MSETSFMMKSHKVLTTSYLCRNPNSPISCDCAGAPLIPVLPDLPSCEHKVLWWIWLLGACLIILIVGAAVALYNRTFFWKFKPYSSKKERKEERFSASMQQKEQP